MKLSQNFIEILGNFSSINSGMVFRPGNILRTISSDSTIFAQAEVDEIFDREFGVYDLNKMMALLSINKANPEIEIEDESIVFIGLGGKGRIRQRLTDLALIAAPADKTIRPKNIDIEFVFNQDVFKWIYNVSSILKCPHMIIQGEVGKPITINAIDVRGDIVDSGYVALDDIAEKNFKAVLKNENIKVIPGKYNLKIVKSGYCVFSHAERKLEYFISLDSKHSSFEE